MLSFIEVFVRQAGIYILGTEIAPPTALFIKSAKDSQEKLRRNDFM